MGAQARLIQLINGPGQSPGENLRPARPDEDAYFKYLNLGFRVAPTADQDNHHENWGSATPARTAIVATTLTKQSVLDAMRLRHVYATEDRNLRVVIKVNGRLCGDVISPLPAGALTISYRITDDDEPNAEYAIHVFRDAVGGPTAQMVTSVTAEDDGEGTIDDVGLGGGAQYLFFKVVQFDEDGGEEYAWTAPVWFQSQPEDVIVTPPGGGGPGVPPPARDRAVASRRSDTFHVSPVCLDAQRISPQNLVRGAEARRGRRQHGHCPRTR